MNRTCAPILIVALLAFPVLGRAEEKAAPPAESLEEGARAALRGETERALRIAAGRGSEPGAFVLLASVSLEAGLPEEAAMMVERLGKLRPEAAETKLLRALLVERRERPGAEWLDSGLAALKVAHPLPETPPLLKLDPQAEPRLEGKAIREAARCLRPLRWLPIRSLRRALAGESSRERKLLNERLNRLGLRCPEPAASAPRSPTEPAK